MLFELACVLGLTFITGILINLIHDDDSIVSEREDGDETRYDVLFRFH